MLANGQSVGMLNVHQVNEREREREREMEKKSHTRAITTYGLMRSQPEGKITEIVPWVVPTFKSNGR